MNKQELNKQLSFSLIDCPSDRWDKEYNSALKYVMNFVQQLPEGVIVPPIIGKFIEENEDPIFEICAWADHYGNDGRKCDDPELSAVLDWFGENSNEFYRAVVIDYEVEKEQLYYVDFINDGDVHKRLVLDNENGKHDIVDWSENLIGLVQEMFTESDVKKANPDFMAFAVKVED